MTDFVDKLSAVPSGDHGALASWFEEFSGSLHIEDWTPSAWARLANLCNSCGITAKDFEEVGIDPEDVECWREGATPNVSVRRSALWLIGERLSKPIAA